MSDPIKVDTKDKYRTLLTDVLPYELPLWFTNFTLYKRLKNDRHLAAYKNISGLSGEKNRYIPLDYSISRGGNKTPRSISIMHPFAQLKVCDFYNDYNDLIEYYCTRSKFSLRFPYRKSTKFYGKTQEGSKLKDGVESVDEERIVSSSYFKYKKYPFLYRFFESYEYHKLEKQFHSMLQVDIAKCFPSIYTHSVSWAIKSKRVAKAMLGSSGDFDGAFDNLMQLINYGETNGIIIGPEVSRIFSEIILQKIDLNLVKNLEEQDLHVGEDYNFRRYVDDYFIFFRSEDAKKAFIKTLEACLLEYKMYLNEAKTTIISRPFATEISLAKHSIRHAINDYFGLRFSVSGSETNVIVQLKKPESMANKTISNIKMALANHRVEYHSISNYLFGSITKHMLRYMEQLNNVETIEDFHVNWILVDLDVLFFIHAMDIRIRPTDRLARLINELCYKTSGWSQNHKDILHKKIFDHVKQTIDMFIVYAHDISGLETLNLLMILTMLPDKYFLVEENLKRYLDRLHEHSGKNEFYFLWVTFMLYVKNNPEYSELKSRLINMAEEFLLSAEDMFISTEYFIFYFDYLACHYVDVAIRKKMILDVKSRTKDSKGNLITFNESSYEAIVLNKDFIVSWRDPDYLTAALEKREYLFAYS